MGKGTTHSEGKERRVRHATARGLCRAHSHALIGSVGRLGARQEKHPGGCQGR
jgi:hypothetical protein